jgi:hypothetical protein
MFRVQLEVEVPNLDRFRLEVPCPLCELRTPTTMGAIRCGDMIVCRGCHSNLRLHDVMATFHRFKRRFTHMLKKLER